MASPPGKTRLAAAAVALLALLAAAEFFYILHLGTEESPPPAPSASAPSPGGPARGGASRIEIPSRGSLQERQMSRGVYIAGTDIRDVVKSEAAFYDGLRKFLEYLESGDRARLEAALEAFRSTNDQPLNRFRWYSFLYQARCQELLGSTDLLDLYGAKGWITPSHYRFFFAGDLPLMTRYFLRAFCRENAEALQAALELYAEEHGGSRPPTLEALVPRYVNRIPRCPACDVDTYSPRYLQPQGGDRVSLDCDRHGDLLSRSGPSPSSPEVESEDLLDDRFFVYWLLLEDYSEQERRDLWSALFLKAADLEPGDVVADLGCGRGLFTFDLAERVGPRGKVFAMDINPGVLRFVDYELENRPGLPIRTVLGKKDDVALPEGSLDAALLVAVYHFQVPSDDPRDPENLRENLLPWLRTIHRALKPGGRLVIQDGRIDPEIVREQVVLAGFEDLPDQALAPKLHPPTMTVFRKPR